MINDWKQIAQDLALALECILDSPEYDTGWQIDPDHVDQANDALDARIAQLERESP